MIAKPSRLARRADPARVPRAVDGEAGMFVVDATWGLIQPMSLAPGVRTVGELEVIEHLRAGRPLVDCRLPEYVDRGTIPGAVNIPHGEIAQRIAELDPVEPTVVFCNGPQCTATAQATDALLAAGWPAERLLYYRGGIHDWGHARPTACATRELKQHARPRSLWPRHLGDAIAQRERKAVRDV
jgi:rhodanese-related sulfurtransferase